MNPELIVWGPPLDEDSRIGFRTWIGPGGDACTTIPKQALALDAASFQRALAAHREAVERALARRRRWFTGFANSGLLLLLGGWASVGGVNDLLAFQATADYTLRLTATFVLVTLLVDALRRLAVFLIRRELGLRLRSQ